MDILHTTTRTLTSKTAQRALLNTILLTAASAFLYGLAVIAYLLFYNAYLPDQVTTLPIHLQYGYGPNPYGISALSNIKDYQAYDISVTLTVPRSPVNVDRGNFMIALYLLDREGTGPSSPGEMPLAQPDTSLVSLFPTPDPRSYLSSRRVLHSSHRPALVPYTDPIVSLASRLLFLPGHLLFPGSSRASASTLTVSLAEKVSFPSSTRGGGSGKSVPSSLFLELQSGQDLRVSAASVTVTAQLSGLRWFMHRYRVLAFLLGTTAFWACEVAAMGAVWGVLGVLVFSTGQRDGGGPKDELPGKPARKRLGGAADGDDMSDTERTFPTTGRQPPLKYESVKQEDDTSVGMAELPLAPGVEADDEDDEGEVGAWRDSGIGTGYSDAASGLRRRGSGKGR